MCAFYVTSIIYWFTAYSIYVIMDIILLALVGLITSRLAKIGLRYWPIVNVAIYALTLPLLLNAVYILLNTITGFTIEHFQFMYNAISYIYVIIAILMIRSEMIKQQMELLTIKEEQKRIKEEMERQKEEEKRKEEQKRKEKEKEKEKDNEQQSPNGKEVPEGIIERRNVIRKEEENVK